MSSGMPLFGFMHLLQTQIESDAEDAGTVLPHNEGRWQPLDSEDHLRFRNWIYSHLAANQIPPLVDSVHFLARADPREPHERVRECSAGKAMGYLASAFVFVHEEDASLLEEAREMVRSAEAYVKSCVLTEGESFTLLRFLRTEWPMTWLLHQIAIRLEPAALPHDVTLAPPAGGVAGGMSSMKEASAKATEDAAKATKDARAAVAALSLRLPPGAVRKPQQQLLPLSRSSEPESQSSAAVLQQASSLSVPGHAAAAVVDASDAALVPLTASVKAEFRDMGEGLFVIDTARLEVLLSGQLGVSGHRLSQLFRRGLPVQRTSLADSECASGPPASGGAVWSEHAAWGRRLLSVHDPDFQTSEAAYAASLEPPVTAGLYLEAGSAGDPYNKEWLDAYREAARRLGVRLREFTDPLSAQKGQLTFWRINQMFEGGRLAGAQGVGLAIAEHLMQKVEPHGAVLWPRPEAMQFYQDKLALRELFLQAGVPAPKSWVVTTVGELEGLLQQKQLTEQDFPLVLKHPYAASSRGMAACDSLADVRQVVGAWLTEHKAPCLLQKRLRISRDMRLTYVGGEIVHGYWRVKPSADVLTAATGQGGSTLDFRVPKEEMAPFVRDFARRTGIAIGGMDIAFEDGDNRPMVLEVSPTFDLNPEPPPEWAHKPYRDYKKTDDYIRRRAENYAGCAQKIIEYALGRRSPLFVDIDNTVSASWERIRRAALPSWPGQTFDSSRAFSPEELAKDRPLAGAASALTALAREWEVIFLTARGFKGALSETKKWLRTHGFPDARVIVVQEARHKPAWLEDVAAQLAAEADGTQARWRQQRQLVLVDDLSRGHHTAATELDEETIALLQRAGLTFEVFRPEETQWPDLAQRLLAFSAQLDIEVPPKRYVPRGRGRCNAAATGAGS
eukprot:TRINITY_DN35678_c0_g2_i2.p1 TRINITY_DN35678_c0_g2~~TRINITY_DN35678_c0_g2_i2.p1  ORF type:complete len:903 (+),score=218.32 TRINITY_DN35678_c0_g2_i2:76-2784(+)